MGIQTGCVFMWVVVFGCLSRSLSRSIFVNEMISEVNGEMRKAEDLLGVRGPGRDTEQEGNDEQGFLGVKNFANHKFRGQLSVWPRERGDGGGDRSSSGPRGTKWIQRCASLGVYSSRMCFCQKDWEMGGDFSLTCFVGGGEGDGIHVGWDKRKKMGDAFWFVTNDFTIEERDFIKQTIRIYVGYLACIFELFWHDWMGTRA